MRNLLLIAMLFLITTIAVPEIGFADPQKSEGPIMNNSSEVLTDLEKMQILEKGPLEDYDEQIFLVDNKIWLRSKGETQFHLGESTTDVAAQIHARQDELAELGKNIEYDIVLDLRSEDDMKYVLALGLNKDKMEIGGYYRATMTKSQIAEISKHGIKYDIYPDYPFPNSGSNDEEELINKDPNNNITMDIQDVILFEGFEGAWPGIWTVGDSDPGNGYDYWGDVYNCRNTSGSWSGWCADEGNMPDCENYDDKMLAYMTSPAIYVGNYENVVLTYWLWYDTEENYDFFRRYYSSDGINWTLSAHEYSGSSGDNFIPLGVHLNNFTNYYVMFVFFSDYSIHSYEGAYLDDITITGDDSGPNIITLDDNIWRYIITDPGYYEYYQTAGYWAVVGVRSPNGTDLDIKLYDDDNFSNLLAGSYTTEKIDFVVGDYNHNNHPQFDYPKTYYFSGSGLYYIEYENSNDVLQAPGVNGSFIWPNKDVVEIWDIPLNSGEEFTYTLDIQGSSDMGMAIFKSNNGTYYTGRSSSEELSDNAGYVDESFVYTAPASDWYGLVVWSNDGNSTNYTIVIAGNQPDIAVSPDSHNYGSVPLGDSDDYCFTISNTGNSGLHVSNQEIVGPHASDFSIISGPSGGFYLAPGATAPEITIRFAPSALGNRTSTWQIYSDDPDENPFNVSLSGIGIEIPDIDVSPTSYDYGTVEIGSSADCDFTISNTGNGVLYLSSQQIVGSHSEDFNIISGPSFPFYLSSGATQEITIRFAPSAEGFKEARWRIHSDDPDENPFEVPLSGTCENVSIDDYQCIIPSDYSLFSAYPNPFNPTTTIKYALPEASHVNISIYNLLGHEIASLVNEQQPAGYHQAIWNANSKPSGMYFYKLKAGEFTETKKMLLLK